jgi:hypothetical protein
MCTPFWKDGNNAVDVVSDAAGVACWMYGTANGAGDLYDLAVANVADGGMVVDVASVMWPASAPFTVYGGVNLLVCDLTDNAAMVTAVIPVTREA